MERPYLYPEHYKEHKLRPAKGVLLYGPPGCGKTMIAKAVANSMAEKLWTQRGEKINGYVLNVKGPELLNKYVGETERKIREVFQKANEKAADDVPVVIFFDEMDALFRTRGSGISSDVESTTVPQCFTELDGVEGLRNVVVIGASNRPDLIDQGHLAARSPRREDQDCAAGSRGRRRYLPQVSDGRSADRGGRNPVARRHSRCDRGDDRERAGGDLPVW